MGLLYIMTILNIAMLLVNVWMRIDGERTLEEIKSADCHGRCPRNDKERSGFDETS